MRDTILENLEFWSVRAYRCKQEGRCPKNAESLVTYWQKQLASHRS